jgi:hypothetical protein
MPIPFSGQLTEADFAAAGRLASKRAWWAIRGFGLLFALILVTSKSWEGFSEQPLATLFVWAFGLMILTGGWPLTPLLARRHWRNNKLLQIPVSGQVSADGIDWRVEGVSSSVLPWSLFFGYRRSETMTVIYQGPNQVFCVPRRYFRDDHDWTAFNELVSERLPSK